MDSPRESKNFEVIIYMIKLSLLKDLLTLSDKIQSIIQQSLNRPIAEMNFIEFFNPSEPETSYLLEMILSYRNRNGDFKIFESFQKDFLYH